MRRRVRAAVRSLALRCPLEIVWAEDLGRVERVLQTFPVRRELPHAPLAAAPLVSAEMRTGPGPVVGLRPRDVAVSEPGWRSRAVNAGGAHLGRTPRVPVHEPDAEVRERGGHQRSDRRQCGGAEVGLTRGERDGEQARAAMSSHPRAAQGGGGCGSHRAGREGLPQRRGEAPQRRGEAPHQRGRRRPDGEHRDQVRVRMRDLRSSSLSPLPLEHRRRGAVPAAMESLLSWKDDDVFGDDDDLAPTALEVRAREPGRCPLLSDCLPHPSRRARARALPAPRACGDRCGARTTTP